MDMYSKPSLINRLMTRPDTGTISGPAGPPAGSGTISGPPFDLETAADTDMSLGTAPDIYIDSGASTHQFVDSETTAEPITDSETKAAADPFGFKLDSAAGPLDSETVTLFINSEACVDPCMDSGATAETDMNLATASGPHTDYATGMGPPGCTRLG